MSLHSKHSLVVKAFFLLVFDVGRPTWDCFAGPESLEAVLTAGAGNIGNGNGKRREQIFFYRTNWTLKLNFFSQKWQSADENWMHGKR